MVNTPAQVQPPAPADDEIDLRQLIAALGRRWRLIAAVSGGTLALSAIVTLLQKPVWEGEFQIVLASKASQASGAQALLQSNPGLASLVGAKGGEDSLETEVKILESPSVLKPVFDFVKQQKARAGMDVGDWRYDDWLEGNLEIKLEKGTAVLNLAYRDSDQSLVRPVLQRISTAYQAYSGRDRERGLALAIRYLDEQIARYRLKSVASLRRAQEFAIEQDLTALRGQGQNDTEIRESLNIEGIRVQAANQIRNIDQQLKQLQALGTDPDAVMYRGLAIPELATKGIYQALDDMDTQLANLRARYTEKEDSIRLLLERRRLLIGVLRRQTLGYLLAQRSDAQARLASAERPKGVLIKYRELLREAARDEATLTRLEGERQALALEQARKQEPWELISTPTLLDRPVSPRKGRNLALGLLAGLVLGSGAALVVDRRSGLVFATDELRQLLPYPLLATLDAADPGSWATSLELLAQGTLAGQVQVALIPAGTLEPGTIQTVAQQLQAALQRRDPAAQVLVTADLASAGRCNAQLLLACPGAASRHDLARLRQNLQLQGQAVGGLLLVADAG